MIKKEKLHYKLHYKINVINIIPLKYKDKLYLSIIILN